MHTALEAHSKQEWQGYKSKTHMDELKQRQEQRHAKDTHHLLSSGGPERSPSKAGTNFSWSGVWFRRAKFITIPGRGVFPPVYWSPKWEHMYNLPFEQERRRGEVCMALRRNERRLQVCTHAGCGHGQWAERCKRGAS